MLVADAPIPFLMSLMASLTIAIPVSAAFTVKMFPDWITPWAYNINMAVTQVTLDILDKHIANDKTYSDLDS